MVLLYLMRGTKDNEWEKKECKDKDKVKVKEKVKEKERAKNLDSITFEIRKELQERPEFQYVNVEKQYVKFVDYLGSKGRRYKDYLAGFRNWLRNDLTEKEDMSDKIPITWPWWTSDT